MRGRSSCDASSASPLKPACGWRPDQRQSRNCGCEEPGQREAGRASFVREAMSVLGGKAEDICSSGGFQPLTRLRHATACSEAAVRSAITLPWSDGQTEGQVTRLIVRRQMYGRGNIDLLQARLIGAE